MHRRPQSRICRLAWVAALAAVIAAGSTPPATGDEASAQRAQRLNAVAHWGYWLSGFDVDAVAAAPHDLMVIDNGVSARRKFVRERTAEEVARMKQRSNGGARILLSYLSIGEAERYRAYWRPEWHEPGKGPPWLGEANPNWDGNYAVQFWHPDWRRLMFGTPESYVDTIIAQGFDGMYLDRADAFEQWEASHPSARSDMVSFLTELADYARAKNPRFLVIMQNAEELLDEPAVLDSIDGIAKEDLLYGVDGPAEPNQPDEVTDSLLQLRIALGTGRKVLVVEYLSELAKMEEAAKHIRAEGFVPYFAPRLLDCLNPPAVPGANRTLPPHPCH
jgi:cysteinyl-tRNA synthetase